MSDTTTSTTRRVYPNGKSRKDTTHLKTPKRLKHYRLKAESDVFCVGNIYFVNLSTLKKLVSYLSYYILKSHILLTVHVFFSEKWNLYICKRLSDQADDTPITGAQYNFSNKLSITWSDSVFAIYAFYLFAEEPSLCTNDHIRTKCINKKFESDALQSLF